MEELDLIERAEKAALRLEQANKEMEALVSRQAGLDARRILGGQSEAGVKAIEVTEKEKLKTDMQNYFKGTALERALK